MTTIRAIQDEVCRQFNVTRSDLLSDSRKRRYARPRQVGMYLASQLSSYSTTTIAHLFNRRDHTTMLHAKIAVARLMETDEDFGKQVIAMRARLDGSGAERAAMTAAWEMFL